MDTKVFTFAACFTCYVCFCPCACVLWGTEHTIGDMVLDMFNETVWCWSPVMSANGQHSCIHPRLPQIIIIIINNNNKKTQFFFKNQERMHRFPEHCKP